MANVHWDWLNERMETLMAEARASGWSEDGQIIYIRRGMERAYEAYRQAARVRSINSSTAQKAF